MLNSASGFQVDAMRIVDVEALDDVPRLYIDIGIERVIPEARTHLLRPQCERRSCAVKSSSEEGCFNSKFVAWSAALISWKRS